MNGAHMDEPAFGRQRAGIFGLGDLAGDWNVCWSLRTKATPDGQKDSHRLLPRGGLGQGFNRGASSPRISCHPGRVALSPVSPPSLICPSLSHVPTTPPAPVLRPKPWGPTLSVPEKLRLSAGLDKLSPVECLFHILYLHLLASEASL